MAYELRFFSPANVDGIDEDLESLANRLGFKYKIRNKQFKEESRTDLYFNLERDDIGIKLRHGDLEVKITLPLESKKFVENAVKSNIYKYTQKWLKIMKDKSDGSFNKVKINEMLVRYGINPIISNIDEIETINVDKRRYLFNEIREGRTIKVEVALVRIINKYYYSISFEGESFNSIIFLANELMSNFKAKYDFKPMHYPEFVRKCS